MGLCFLAGCTPYVGEPLTVHTGPTDAAVGGMVHRVARGETLWSISKRYGVELEALVRANALSDASQLQVGQRLRIPDRRGPVVGPVERSGSSAAAGSPAATGSPASSIWADSSEFVWPVRGRVISLFGTRRSGTVNKGVDIQAAAGAEVVAARGGRVSYVHEGLPGFGKTIILDHGDGFASVYAYVGQILVRSGEPVTQRQAIARVGRSGRLPVPALHFEIRRNQKAQNPLYYLP